MNSENEKKKKLTPSHLAEEPECAGGLAVAVMRVKRRFENLHISMYVLMSPPGGHIAFCLLVTSEDLPVRGNYDQFY